MSTSRESSGRRDGREARFIEEYLRTFNALEAARTAGYSKNDTKIGWVLLKRPRIQAEITRLVLERRQRLEISADHLDQALAWILFDPREEGAGGPSFADRIAAAREMGKLRGLYIQKHVFTGATLEQLLSLAGQREKALPAAQPPLRLVAGGKS